MDFKSDDIDTDAPYSFIPTGAILTIAGSYTQYSNPSLVEVGLIPCDGRVLSTALEPKYIDLWNIIGTRYGGTNSSSFLVPNLVDMKRVALSTNNNTTLGTTVNTSSHFHTAFGASNTPTVNVLTNSDAYTHTHSSTFNTGGWTSVNHNTHNAGAFNWASGAPNTGLRAKADGTSQAASVGHTHSTMTISPGAVSTVNAWATGSHSHSNPTITTNASSTAEGQHIHSLTYTAVNTGSSNLYPPVYDVLFFIKA